MLIKKDRWFIRYVMAIFVEFQHALVVADIDKKKIRNVVRKTFAERRNISLVKDVRMRK